MVENNPNRERNIRRYNAYAQHRDALGFTDYYISKECDIAQSTLSDWKGGRYCPNADKLLKICKMVEANLEDILVE